MDSGKRKREIQALHEQVEELVKQRRVSDSEEEDEGQNIELPPEIWMMVYDLLRNDRDVVHLASCNSYLRRIAFSTGYYTSKILGLQYTSIYCFLSQLESFLTPQPSNNFLVLGFHELSDISDAKKAAN